MATQTEIPADSEQVQSVEQKIQKAKALYADAPELAKTALDNVIRELTASGVGAASESRSQGGSAGRIGSRQGTVSELTLLVPFAEGGAARLRAMLDLLDGNFEAADKLGTVHDMRFVFIDNDTRLLFATAYDGDWDAYIDDFATKVPDYLDILFSGAEGWPGVRSPRIKDWIVSHQIPASGWYVAHPDLTVVETKRLKRSGKALDELLDKISE